MADGIPEMRRRFRVRFLRAVGLTLIIPTAPAISQTGGSQDPPFAVPNWRTPPIHPTEQGHNAAVGEQIVGQRQLKTAGVADAGPLNRIDNRVQNRIQNRLRTRIDEGYRPQANASSPYEISEAQSRKKQ
jgi:hypothetical protein